MEMATRNATLAEVFVVLATDPGHDRFKARQFVLQVLDRVMEDIQLGGLLSDQLP